MLFGLLSVKWLQFSIVTFLKIQLDIFSVISIIKQSPPLVDYFADQIAIKCQLEKTTSLINCISEPL